jgi:type IV pilus assembly protein PilQ
MNKTEAAISQNSEVVSISTVAQQGVITRQVVRDNAEIGLTVTPQITSEGSVIMDINVTRAFPGSVVDVETQARAINSRSAQTRILVKNGQTAVIGGLYNSTETQTEDGTPGLKNIPVLGWLFKSQSKDRSKNELIFFLTPRILNLQEQSPAQKRMSKAIN